MLFFVDAKNHVILHPDAIKLCPELGVLSEKEVVFIVLAYDYKSPYKQFPERERERQAMWNVFGDNIVGLLDRHSIKVAREKYKMLQWSPKIELVNSFYRKIEVLTGQMESESTPGGIKKCVESIDMLKNMITKYENEIDTDIQNKGVIKGGSELSFIEEMQRNMKMYESTLKSKPVTV